MKAPIITRRLVSHRLVLRNSLYRVTLEPWSIRRGLWAISDDLITAVRFFGAVKLEQLLTYSVTTVLV